MQDPIEKLQENPTFQKVDRKVDWAQVTLFSTVGLLILIALAKNVVA
ncbi:MAG: hypothetical protein U5L06_14710 [Rhodovibrio sp.]|nr:hypothetical protein [Rhodovibrio sp.]